MVGEHMTLNELIQVANKKAGSDKAVLMEIVARENFKGTVSEVMAYVDSNQELFEDPHLDDVKVALSKFLGKLPTEKTRLTLASMKRELEEFKASRPSSKGNGGEIISQDDLDKLLAQAGSLKPPRKPRIIEPMPEKKQGQESGKETNGSMALDQSDIDALLSHRGPVSLAEPPVQKEKSGETAVDQDFVDALLSSRPSSIGANGTGSRPSGGVGSIVSQDDIDTLLSGNLTPAKDGDGGRFPGEHVEPRADESTAPVPPADTDGQAINVGDDDLSGQIEVDRILMEAANDATDDTVPSEAEEPTAERRGDPAPVAPHEESAGEEAADQEATEVQPLSPKPEPRSPMAAAPKDVDRVAAPMGGERRQTADGNMPPAERIVEEKGNAQLIKEFYRIYLRENGSFTTVFEADSRDAVKDELQNLLENYPAKAVFLGRITRKEVLVIKEDLIHLPISVQVDLGE